jgi:ADP-ribose pyrophosphatase YjhB (NUDIX family)
VHWDNPAPVVAALIELEGRILLARNRAWPEKMYALVTGFLERDETPLEAVAREVAEETGLHTRAATLIGVDEFRRKNEVIVAYHVEAEGTVRLGEDWSITVDRAARLRPATGYRAGDGRLDARPTAGRLSLP